MAHKIISTVWLFVFVTAAFGCIAAPLDQTEEIIVPQQDGDIGYSSVVIPHQDADVSCSRPTFQIVDLPDGTTIVIETPTLCNDHYRDTGDPPDMSDPYPMDKNQIGIRPER